MATEASKFQVGVFVIIAAIIAVGTVIWLGASRFFQQTEVFVTYFSESVQGLDPGSAVKYRGVPAGRVQDIRIAPDGDLIEVVMDIDAGAAKFLKDDDTLRAQLELSGITGLRYVEVERRVGDALLQAPVLSFKPAHQVIPSSRSSFKAIQSALGDVYDKIMELDLAGISTDARATLQSANRLLHDERIPTLLTNLKVASASATQLTTNLQTMTAGVELAPAVNNATQASAEAKELFANLNQVTATKLGVAADNLNALALSAQQVVVGLQYSVERLDRTVGSLRSLSEQVREQPSLLLFSAPPPARRSDTDR